MAAEVRKVQFKRLEKEAEAVGRAGRGGVAETVELRRIAGLGVHLSEVYPDTRCFLKGLFNAMEAFRKGVTSTVGAWTP